MKVTAAAVDELDGAKIYEYREIGRRCAEDMDTDLHLAEGNNASSRTWKRRNLGNIQGRTCCLLIPARTLTLRPIASLDLFTFPYSLLHHLYSSSRPVAYYLSKHISQRPYTHNVEPPATCDGSTHRKTLLPLINPSADHLPVERHL